MKRKEIIELEKEEQITIKYRNKYLGVYKDQNNELYAIDIRCPHLGCILSFNKETKNYECPCHGSKFNYRGDLVASPSIYNAKKHNI